MPPKQLIKLKPSDNKALQCRHKPTGQGSDRLMGIYDHNNMRVNGTVSKTRDILKSCGNDGIKEIYLGWKFENRHAHVSFKIHVRITILRRNYHLVTGGTGTPERSGRKYQTMSIRGLNSEPASQLVQKLNNQTKFMDVAILFGPSGKI